MVTSLTARNIRWTHDQEHDVQCHLFEDADHGNLVIMVRFNPIARFNKSNIFWVGGSERLWNVLGVRTAGSSLPFRERKVNEFHAGAGGLLAPKNKAAQHEYKIYSTLGTILKGRENTR